MDGAYVFRRLGWSLYRFVSVTIPSLKIYDAILDTTIMYHKGLLCTISCVRNNPLNFLRFSQYDRFNCCSTFLRSFSLFNFAMAMASTVCTSFHMNKIYDRCSQYSGSESLKDRRFGTHWKRERPPQRSLYKHRLQTQGHHKDPWQNPQQEPYGSENLWQQDHHQPTSLLTVYIRGDW